MDEAIAPAAMIPAALAEPTVPVERSWTGLLFLANVGLINMAHNAPLVVAPLAAGSSWA